VNANDDASSLAVLEGSWTLSAIEGFEIPAGLREHPSLSVDAQGRVSGSSGVNRFHGALDPDGARVFGPLATTRRAGPPQAMALETAFLNALGNAAFVEGGDGQVTLSGPDGGQLTLVRAERLP
jgi:heat shock protein HslJ